MEEMKGPQEQEREGKLQFHSCLRLTENKLASLKVCNLKAPLQRACIFSVQFSCSVVSDSLRPHEWQHTRPACHHQLPELTQTHVH